MTGKCRATVAFGIGMLLFGRQVAVGQMPPPMTYKVIVADEGNGKVHCINLNNPGERWSIATANRDMQLVGGNRLMVSVGDGYAEYDVTNGAFITKVPTGGGVQSTFRLSDSSTFIGSDGNPASITKVDGNGREIGKIDFAFNASIRIVRPTADGTFLVGGKVAGTIYECDSTGVIIWEAQAGGEPYMALRLPNGNTLVSNGSGGQMVLVGGDGNVIKRFPTQEDKNGSEFWSQAAPNFFAGFQILKNGNIVVSNWEGHGGGNGGKGFQLIEIDSGLTRVVSYWKQDPAIVSSLHGVLVLDGLDTELMHSDVNGVLAPVEPPPVAICCGIRQPPRTYREAAGGGLFFGEHGGTLFRLDGKSAAVFADKSASALYIRRNGAVVGKWNRLRN